MKSIAYIVPYFGALPRNFALWLKTCEMNDTINWIIFTNDRTSYNYPTNVKVVYCEFDSIWWICSDGSCLSCFKFLFNSVWNIDSYWCLSLFKSAYGEIFEEYLEGYDFWGHCDVDLMWGDIRKFITDDILDRYEKIGFQGHSTLYKNNKEVNSRYKTIIPKKINYIDVFSGKTKYSFDEVGMEDIYIYLKIPYYNKTNFAHLSKYDYSFFLKYLPKEFDYKNKRQIFVWNKGCLKRYYLEKKCVKSEEFMYIHFFCRPIIFKQRDYSKDAKYVIYPDIVDDLKEDVTYEFINKYGKCSKIKYYISSIIYNRKKITIKKIGQNVKRMIKYKLHR